MVKLDPKYLSLLTGVLLFVTLLTVTQYSAPSAILLRSTRLLSVKLDSSTAASNSRPVTSRLRRSAEVTVKGLVFFGPNRKPTQRLLECYLSRNLRRNGGLLSEVIFMLSTEVEGDSLQFVEDVVARTEEFKMHVITHPAKGQGRYDGYYRNLEPDTYYIKVDDDIVWIDDDAIGSLMEVKLSNSDYMVLSANVLNHCDLSWVHGRLGAVLPYGPQNGTGSNWRLLSNTSLSLEGSDAWGMQYDPFGHSWKSGACAAVQHYSFLHREKEGTLDAFKGFDIWNFHSSGYERWSIMTILFQGKDFRGEDLHRDDELAISKHIPQRRHLQAAAVGKALVVHYAYGPQRGYIEAEHPHLLEKYTAIAQKTCDLL